MAVTAAALVTSRIGQSCNMLFLRYTAAAMFSLVKREPRTPCACRAENLVSWKVARQAYPNDRKTEPRDLNELSQLGFMRRRGIALTSSKASQVSPPLVT